MLLSASPARDGGPAPAPGRAAWPARVAVVDEIVEPAAEVEEIPPLEERLAPGEVHIQLRRTRRRVTIGAGLARRPELVAAVRALPGLPGLALSPTGGTFVIGGTGWMGLTAVGLAPDGPALPLDWMVEALRRWLAAALAVPLTAGRVEGAWCPGFSDLGAGGRKLVGLGFRLRRRVAVARGVLAVTAVAPADLALLQACHQLIDLEVQPESCTSLAELSADAGWDADRVCRALWGTRLEAGA